MPPATHNDQQPLHVITRPAWMIDYEVTGIDQNEDPLTHFALFSDCDPTSSKQLSRNQHGVRQ